MLVHQSDLASWAICPSQYRWQREDRDRQTNSALAYGTVIHHAMHVLERTRDLDKAIETFQFYWHPLNIDQLTEPVPRDGWLPRQDYNSLRRKGMATLRSYADLMKYDDSELLALEYEFIVPLVGTEHFLAGTVDRLAARWKRRVEELCIDDFKSGKQKWGLRWNVQGHVYCYASTRPEFWMGFDGMIDGKRYRSEGFGPERGRELALRFDDKPRRFTWINLTDLRFVDGGTRDEQDYARLRLAVEQVAASIEAGIYPLNIDGEKCRFCPYRRNCPPGVGMPDETPV